MLINDLSARLHSCESELLQAVRDVIQRGWLVLGPKVNEFEQRFASYLSVSHCATVGNGTDALELGLRALEILPGERVATVANAGMYTTTALLAIGAKPFYMDVDPDSCNVTVAEVVRAIDAGVRAVVVTHLYGRAVSDVDEIASICAKRNVPLIEDCAQAHGAQVKGKRLGSFGDLGCFSFYPTKNLGALGDGGAVVTNQEEIYGRVTALRQYGWTEKYKVGITGGRNSRLDELQASVLLAFLPKLDIWNKRRREIATYFSQEICHPHVINAPSGETEYVAHLYVVRTNHRAQLQEYLKSKGISSDVHYPIPDYCQSVFGNTYSSLFLPNTERVSKQVLTLPCYPEMSDEDVMRVVEAVNSWSIKVN